MIIVLPVCSKDEHLARLNLELCVKLDGLVPFDILIAHETGFPAAEIIELAKEAFSRVLEYSYPNYIGQPQFPFPHNYVWKMVARQIAQLNQPWFWWEPDAVMFKVGGWQTLETEYQKSGLPFMGAWIEGRKEVRHGYMAGVGVFPAQVVRYASINTFPAHWPWDIALSRYLQMRCHRTLLIDHTIEPVSFRSIEDVQDLIHNGSVIFHKCKDGTLQRLLLGNGVVKTVKSEAPILADTCKIDHNPIEIKPPNIVSKKCDLSQVTIFGIWYSKASEQFTRTIRVLNYCAKNLNVKDVLLFCHPEPTIHTDVRIIKIPKLDFNSYNLFVNREVVKHIQSDFAMCVHEDGFPIRLDLWDNNFLEYDYIGAPWQDGVVGNGGFSILSKRLMNAVAPMVKPLIHSDLLICRIQRSKLEESGFRFAPLELARKFSTEMLGPEDASFGFHGRNSQKYRLGWEIIEHGERQSGPPATRMAGKICIVTTYDKNYMEGGRNLFKSIRRHTDCTGINFKVITADPEVVQEIGEDNCHFVSEEIKSRYGNVKYSKELPIQKYHTSWYRYEMFSLSDYDRVISIDSDCICLDDISYLFSDELNQYDLISVEDHIVSKCFTRLVPELESQGLNFIRLKQRIKEGKVDIQTAVLVANKCILNDLWYQRLLDYANATDFTYSIDQGILNDFIHIDKIKIKLLPLEWDYQDLYEIHCPELPIPAQPIIVHCQESKPFIKEKSSIDARVTKWYDQWWSERLFGESKTIIVLIVWNRFENLKHWLYCWNQCDHYGASLAVIHNLESDNSKYWKLCHENNILYVPRINKGFDIGAFQDVCKERLNGFPNNWENLIWITDDCIPMQKDFVKCYLSKLQNKSIPCYEISDQCKRHIRTTGFLVTKTISKNIQFPTDPILNREDCYQFEHKGYNLYEQIVNMGFKPFMLVHDLKNAPLWDKGARGRLNLMTKHERVFPFIPSRHAEITSAKKYSSGGLLDDLAIKHKADKSSLYHNFAVKYDKILFKFKDSFTNILEIGVAQGQSLKMWADYFTKATIHGADISDSSRICESYSARIKFHLTDQGNLVQLKNLEQFSPYDLIIDDGNHFWREQILSFDTLFSYLKSGGIYIVEDTCTSYWTEYKNHPVSCMDYFKTLVDKVNLNGSRGIIPKNPSPDFTDWEKGWHRREDCHFNLPEFESIHFMNSIIVIYKR